MNQSLDETTTTRNNGAQPATDGTPTTNRPPMPEPLEIFFENIPDELTRLDQWVTSRPKWNGKKWDKPPLSVHGTAASSTARVSWTSFETLKKYYPQKTFSYIGFVLTKTAKIAAIDLDGCRNRETGAITLAAQEIIERFASYTEVSPSGEGIRIFILITRWELDKDGTKVKAPWRRGGEKAEIEIAVSRKYFTVTGHHLDGTPASVQKNQAALEWLIETYFAKPTKAKPTQSTAPISLSLDDEQIIEKARKAKNGVKFAAIFDHGGGTHGSSSETDLALLGHLKFYTQDAAQLERLWRASAVWREEKAGKRPDYVQRTITAALENITATYDPARRITSMMNGSAPKIKAAPARADLIPAPEIETPAATAGEVLPPADRDLVLHCLDCEEAGDAELFAHLYIGRRVLFDHSEKQWYMWGGHHYRADKTGIIRRLVIAQLATQYLHHAAELTREAEAEGEAGAHKRAQADHLVKRAKQLRTLQRIDNILKLAQSWLGIEGGDWDNRADLLAVKNGVLEIETGTLRAGQTSDTIRTVAPAEWRGLNAPAPRWEQFTLEIFGGEVELSNFLQRLLGVGLFGAVKEHRLPILWGEGRNGKDTLLETITAVLGSCAGAVSSDVLVSEKRPRGGAASPHLCDLQGRRIAWVSETDEGARLSVGQVKYLTGGGSISARPLYGRQFEFAPSHLLLLITNHKPHAPADDYALWKRLLLVPFTQKFVDNPTGENEHLCDIHLKEKLETEASGILAWLVRGYIEWKRDGLKPPEAVMAATEEYHRDEDTLADFVEVKCVEEKTATARAGELFKTYREWADETGVKPLGSKTFGQKMQKRYAREKDEKGFYYRNIGILAPAPSAPSAPCMSKTRTRTGAAAKSYDNDGADGADGAGFKRENEKTEKDY